MGKRGREQKYNLIIISAKEPKKRIEKTFTPNQDWNYSSVGVH